MRRLVLIAAAAGAASAILVVGAGSYLYGVRATLATVERHPLILDPSCVEIVDGKPRVVPGGKVAIRYVRVSSADIRTSQIFMSAEPGSVFNTAMNGRLFGIERLNAREDARYEYGNKLRLSADVISSVESINFSYRMTSAWGHFYLQSTNEGLIADLISRAGKGRPLAYGVSEGGKVYVTKENTGYLEPNFVDCDLDINGVDVQRLAPARYYNQKAN